MSKVTVSIFFSHGEANVRLQLDWHDNVTQSCHKLGLMVE